MLHDENHKDKKIKDAAKLAGIHDFIKNSLYGYETILEESGNNLSGGQKQRISIARAILKDAPILLLDEATSSLDAETENEIHKTLEKLTKNKTTITVVHKLSNIVDSDQIIIFSKGKEEKKYYVEEGTVEFSNNNLLILTSTAKNLKDLNQNYIKSLLNDAEKKLGENSFSDKEKYLLSHKISTLREIN